MEIDKVIKSNYGIFESINLKIQEEKKIKESVKNYEKKLLYLKKQISDKEKLKEDFENLKEDFENLNNLILKGKKIYNKLLSENDYIRKNNILKNRKKYIAIVVHLYNINLWKEIYLYILNLKKFDICIDLYVNIAVDDEEDLLKKDFVNLKKKLEGINWLNKVIITNNDNKGMDSGGFLTSYLKILELKIDYDFIIKIHSKSNNNWRNLLLYSLLGNDKIIQNNFNLINKENIGMIGYQTMSLNENLPINKKSYKFMDEYLNFLNVEKKNNGFFIPGTIFIIKDYILKEYFTEEIISKIYKNFKSNYCGLFDNKLEERPHALERLYGLLVYNMNLNVISYDKN